MDTRYRRKQVAIRRLLLDPNGRLNPGARALAVELKRVCNPRAVLVYDRHGAVDPIGTAAAAATREVWDHFVRLLHLEPFEAVNLREEEE
jgi:hypothetical protein